MGTCSSKHYNYKNAICVETLTVDGRALLERCIAPHRYMDCMSSTIIRKIIPRYSIRYEKEFISVLHKIRLNNPRYVSRVLHVERTSDSIHVYLPDYGSTDLFSLVSKISTILPVSQFCDQCTSILITLARAINNLHQLRIVHGDIKMENVMYYKDNPVLIDFDGAAILPCRNKVHLAATFEYSSPERIQHGKIRFANDVWSFGVTMFACFEGRVPFSRNQIRTFNITDTVDIEFMYTPEWIQPIIRKILKVDYKQRPTMGEIIHHLSCFQNIEPLCNA